MTSVEAQRVIAVVDDSIKRLELVSLLPYIIENLKRFSVILGSDLVQVLEEHDRVQSSYQKAVSKFLLEQRRSQSASPTTSNVSSRRSSDVSQVLENEDGILREAIALQESRASSAISKRNDIIRRLKNDIYNVEKHAEEHSRRIITEAAKQDASEMKNSDSKKSKLQQETIELKKKLEGDTLTHRESELALEKA
ncbi:hypothetical protein OS493_040121 [Desmophyllum pertusum]|uniref:Dynein regulatory complex protein 10 n=1 Tax=Desmophyllum pertusum TaxID=174260 RepID=A0A9X0CU25_9CNID|nr:hypothetical protein OS493_040121 [Desmophyllum pertusum]